MYTKELHEEIAFQLERSKKIGLIGDGFGVQDISDLLDEIERLQSQSSWVSVDERLPEDNDWVIMYAGINFPYGKPLPGYYDYRFKKWFDTLQDCDGFTSVTHWQPIPQPPSEVKE